MAVHIHPVDIPPRFYKPLGQIVAGWNLTEALISSTIWHIHKIKDPRIGRLFTYRPNSAEKLRIFKITVDRYVSVSDPIKANLLTLYGEADKLRGRRNTFVHGLWGRMPKERQTWKVFYLKDTDDTYQLKREEVTLHGLNDMAARVRKLNKDLKKLMCQIGAPPP